MEKIVISSFDKKGIKTKVIKGSRLSSFLGIDQRQYHSIEIPEYVPRRIGYTHYAPFIPGDPIVARPRIVRSSSFPLHPSELFCNNYSLEVPNGL